MRSIYIAAMDLEQTARCLAELGNVARLRIFSLLVRAGDDGLIVGEVQRALGLPASTLAFHLRGLVGAGLVGQERLGREVRCRPDFARLNAAFAYFRDACCQGVDVPAPQGRRRSLRGATAAMDPMDPMDPMAIATSVTTAMPKAAAAKAATRPAPASGAKGGAKGGAKAVAKGGRKAGARAGRGG
jgi:ArsR family transcriptional regulator, arsenate/arsenite/antimonite-responsive transcriptional repressor